MKRACSLNANTDENSQRVPSDLKKTNYLRMKRLFFLLVFLPVYLQAQVSDDFSDGNFTENPLWSGTTENFAVNTGFQLQSKASAASKSFLTTYSEVFDNAVWEFWVKINYNPTSSNYASIYVISDRADLSGDVNGYYIQIGNTSDEVSLYLQQG